MVSASPDSPVQALYRLGAEAHPDVRWTWPEFSAAWQAFGTELTERSTTADDYLRLACLTARPGAFEAFDRQFLQPLLPLLLPLCGAPDLADEALSRLREKLLTGAQPKLQSYRAPGNFRAWLRVTATRTALDVLRSRASAAKVVELSEHLRDLATGPEAQLLRAEFGAVFNEVLRSAVGDLSKQERRALRLHLIDGWNITQIGRCFGVHRATAARWLVSARANLERTLREKLADRLDLNSEEVERAMQQMRSQIDIRVSNFYSTTARRFSVDPGSDRSAALGPSGAAAGAHGNQGGSVAG